MLGAALWLGRRRFPRCRITDEENELISEFDVKFQLERLNTSDDVIEAAEKVRLDDFQFEWYHLYKYKELVLFLLRRTTEDFPRLNRVSPISRNDDLCQRSSPFRLFFEVSEQFLNPSIAIDKTPRSFDEIVFEQMLFSCLPVAKKPRGRPTGRQWDDSLQEAALEAFKLWKYEGHSKMRSVKLALSWYDVVRSLEEATSKNFIVTNDNEGAYQPLMRELNKLIALDEAGELGME